MRFKQSACAFNAIVLQRSMLKCDASRGGDNPNEKAEHMTLLNQIQNALRKRALYLRTKHELETLPLDVALDLDIYRGDASRIAARAVYGH